MSDVANDIRKAVDGVYRVPPGTTTEYGRPSDEAFMKLRTHVAGTLIAAKRELVPGDEWLVTDMRIVDIVMAWLEQNRR